MEAWISTLMLHLIGSTAAISHHFWCRNDSLTYVLDLMVPRVSKLLRHPSGAGSNGTLRSCLFRRRIHRCPLLQTFFWPVTTTSERGSARSGIRNYKGIGPKFRHARITEDMLNQHVQYCLLLAPSNSLSTPVVVDYFEDLSEVLGIDHLTNTSVCFR